ncbi:MAG: hypothetical protein V3V10_11065 [Planctomycetota bacterium]
MARILILLCFLTAGSLAAQDGGVSILSPEPLFANGWQVYGSYGTSTSFQIRKDNRSTTNRDDLFKIQQRFAVGVNYGLSRDIPGDITFSLLVPFKYNEFRLNFDNDVRRGRASGLGDFGLFVRSRYLWWAAPDSSGRAIHVSVAAGVELPTGSVSQTVNGSRAPRSVQVGSGGYNGVFAHLFAYEAARLEMFLTIQYRMRSIGVGSSGYNHGDIFSVEGNVAYRMIEEEYPGNTLSLEGGLVYSVKLPTRVDGVESKNSGGTVISIKPALIWHPTAWYDIKISFKVPVIYNLHGTQLISPYSISASFGRRF